MRRFITKAKKIRLFYKIFLKYYHNPNSNFDKELGAYVRNLFQSEELYDKWLKYSQTISPDENEILEVIAKGFKIYYYDGCWSYETGNKITNPELEKIYPYTVGALYPETKRISTQAINKLKEKGMINL